MLLQVIVGLTLGAKDLMIVQMTFLANVPYLEMEILDKLLGDQQDSLAEDPIHIMLALDPEPKHYPALARP